VTALLDKPAAPTPYVAPPIPSRFARWWSGWRVALRLARRDAWRSKSRSLLVLLLVALPVAGVVAVDVYTRAERALRTETAYALAQVGPTADAQVVLTGASPVTQAPVGWVGDPGGGPPATLAAVEAALPPGSRLVSRGLPLYAAIEAGEWGVADELQQQDTRDPMVADLWSTIQGRLPVTDGEVALTTSTARRIRAGVGSSVVVTPLSAPRTPVTLAVSGLVADRGDRGGVMLPGAVRADGVASDTYLVDAPRDLTWADVRAVNAVGGIVISRSCLDDRPLAASDTPDDPDALQRATDLAQRYAAIVGVVTVLVVLQIALLAGPAFAVQLRRRQRELGLIGASGGDALALRRTVLASGVVLGTLGAALGVLVGWSAVWLLGGALAFRPLADLVGSSLGVPGLPVEVLGVAAVGVIAAIAAALVPAEAAGRGDVIDTLKGRRPLPPVRTRAPLLGLVLGGVGLLVMSYGTTIPDGIVLGIGVATAEIGLVVLMPFLVSRGALVARWLPLSSRLAVRDAGRHRMRTTAAACAIAAAAAAAVAVSAWASSYQLTSQAADVTYVEGTLPLIVGDTYDENGIITVRGSTTEPEVRRVVAETLPGSRTALLTDLTTTGPGSETYGAVYCVAAASATAVPAPSVSSDDRPCVGRLARGGRFGGSVVVLDDPDQLGTVLGPLAPLDEARRTLAEGGAVALQPGVVGSDGKAALRLVAIDMQTSEEIPSELLRVPAIEVLSGALPADVIVGPAALEPGRPLAGLLTPGATSTLLVLTDQPDSADRPTAQDRVTLALSKAGLDNVGLAYLGGDELPGVVILAVGAGVTALLALLAGLMVTGLALADGRADLVTLASVGAPPGARRRMAASSAGFVSVVGCAAGAVSGLMGARVLLPLASELQGRFVTPWAMLAAVVVGVPLLTAGVAWLTTRADVPLVRRVAD
jgi:putative ABC transport system permease protein